MVKENIYREQWDSLESLHRDKYWVADVNMDDHEMGRPDQMPGQSVLGKLLGKLQAHLCVW